MSTKSCDSVRTAGRGELSPAMWRALDLVMLGQSDGEVGAAVGVRRSTVNAWRHKHPWFRAELARRRAEVWSHSLDRLRALLPVALRTLEAHLASPGASPGVALEVLKLCALPDDRRLANPGSPWAEDYVVAEVRRRREADAADATTRILVAQLDDAPTPAERAAALAALLADGGEA